MMRAGEARRGDFAAAAEAAPQSEDLRVLIADDSAVTRRVMSALVSTIAANGADTCEALRRGVFDVSFVDFHMPDMSGPRAVSLARRVGANPLVVMMGDGPEDAADRTLRGIDPYEFMQKPLEERELPRIFRNVERMRDVSRVLVLADSKASRLMMTKGIEASRFTTELLVVDSGEAALRLLSEEPCDVVFLDYAMPGIDGLETA